MPKPEKRKVYVYHCKRTCFALGKRWFAGSTYKFNQLLSGRISDHLELIDEYKEDVVPTDELAYDPVGRERNRPSEYQAEV